MAINGFSRKGWTDLGAKGIAALALGAAALAMCLGRWLPPRSGHQGKDPALPTVTPDPVSLGVLEPGQSARAALTLSNPSGRPLSVAAIETSCPCVRVTPSTVTVDPRQSARLAVTFDPEEAPNFRGALEVHVFGKALDGSEAFRGRIRLEVRGRVGRP